MNAEGLVLMAFHGQSLLRAQLDHSWDGGRGGSPTGAEPRMFHRGDDAHSGRGILSCFEEERCYQQLQKVPFVKWVSAFLFLT